jgi:hypothetical protein
VDEKSNNGTEENPRFKQICAVKDLQMTTDDQRREKLDFNESVSPEPLAAALEQPALPWTVTGALP